jgi:Cu/Zn superoxide dismutase
VPRFRTLAVAGLAASALLLTSGAAYAGDHDFHRSTHFGTSGFGGSSHISRMTWAYSSDELRELSNATPEDDAEDVFDNARATAFMMSVSGESTFRLRIRGIKDIAIGKVYGAHLHEKQCVAGNGDAAGPHYNTTRDPQTQKASEISNLTEVWLDFEVDAFGNARSTARVPFVPPAGMHSIVLHADPTLHEHEEGNSNPIGYAGARLACLPLEVSTLPESK